MCVVCEDRKKTSKTFETLWGSRKSRGRSVSLHPHCRSRCPFRLFVRCVVQERNRERDREKKKRTWQFFLIPSITGRSRPLSLSHLRSFNLFTQVDVSLDTTRYLLLCVCVCVCVHTSRMKQERNRNSGHGQQSDCHRAVTWHPTVFVAPLSLPSIPPLPLVRFPFNFLLVSSSHRKHLPVFFSEKLQTMQQLSCFYSN